MFFHKYFADFDRVFSVFDESDTFNDQKTYSFDLKLNLTLTALMRKVPILYRFGKKFQPGAHAGKEIYLMTRVNSKET